MKGHRVDPPRSRRWRRMGPSWGNEKPGYSILIVLFTRIHFSSKGESVRVSMMNPCGTKLLEHQRWLCSTRRTKSDVDIDALERQSQTVIKVTSVSGLWLNRLCKIRVVEYFVRGPFLRTWTLGCLYKVDQKSDEFISDVWKFCLI